jgi:arginine-tRNA-protein transferase
VTKPFLTKDLQFFRTAASPCPYLPGHHERKVFTALVGQEAEGLHEALTNMGFRRSQGIAYKPACDACTACTSARVPAWRFEFGRRWQRVLKRNADLMRARVPAEATREQFQLLRAYLRSRHREGGMAEMGYGDYVAMVEDSAVRTHLIEYRYSDGARNGELAAAALVDVLGDGLSLVYSFFDPRARQRSLGAYIILDHIQQARAASYPHVYLGYWIAGAEKMDYKAAFTPIELLHGGAWRTFVRAKD